MSDLSGKFIFASTEEYYYTGEILEKVGDEFYMVKKYGTKEGNPDTVMLFSLYDMSSKDNDMEFWAFFDTKEQLNSYVDWVEEPSDQNPKVVKLVKE